MPLCGKKKSHTVQKVVIPRGMVNPDETTVIEIPVTLIKQPVVVAKRKYPGQGAGQQDAYFPRQDAERYSAEKPIPMVPLKSRYDDPYTRPSTTRCNPYPKVPLIPVK